jgi:ATP-binding cassette subfamily F protein 3
LDRKLITLSGGERTKLLLAQALVAPADVLILDEPTNHLNYEAIKWLAGYLRTYSGAILVVSHEPKFLDLFIHKVIALSPVTRSAVEFQGNYSRYLHQKTEIEKAERKKIDKVKKETERQMDIISRLKGGSKSAQAKSREKILNHQKDSFIPLQIRANREIKIQFEIKRPSGIDVVKISGLVKRYGQKYLDYRSLELNLKKGDRLGVIGPVGAGKSTFVKTIVGEVRPDAGFVKLGNNVDIGYYSQTIDGLNLKNTVLQEIRSSLYSDLPESKIRAYLGRFLFTRDSVFKKVEVLSQGEKSRLALLKLVLGKNNFLILDEPTNHLDIQTKQMVAQALAEFQGTILVVSHDIEFLRQAKIGRMITFPLKK